MGFTISTSGTPEKLILYQMEVLKIRELVRKANQCGMSITDYTIRRAIKQGKLPCRKLDRTYLIPWKLFVRWILCEDDCDNAIS